MKRTVFVVFALLMTMLVSVAVPAQPAAADPVYYPVEDLGFLPDSYPASIARGINEQGQVVG